MSKILDIILWPFRTLHDKWVIRKHIKELRKRDPFIYK